MQDNLCRPSPCPGKVEEIYWHDIDVGKSEDPTTFETPVEHAIAMIAKAFASDPVTNYIARPGKASKCVESLIACLRTCYKYQCHILGAFKCVALCKVVHPGEEKPHMAMEDVLASLDDTTTPHVLGDSAALTLLGCTPYEAELLSNINPDKIIAMGDLMHKFEHFQDDYMEKNKCSLLHLHFIAVNSDSQRLGMGSRMLQQLSDMADSQGLHLYLEASSPQSRALYARNGYLDVVTYRMDDAAPEIYIMARPPIPNRSREG